MKTLVSKQYMLICETCSASLTDYIEANTKREATPMLKAQAKKHGAIAIDGDYYCADCSNQKTDQS